MYELKICHLYPDVLNLYGDRGNIVSMVDRCKRRNIDVSVTNVSIGEKLNASDYDLFFIGGGQDFEQEVLLKDLKGEKTAEIKTAIEEGKTFLAICGGYQMLGNYYETWDGHQYEFIGALNLHTVGGQKRMIGNNLFKLRNKDESLYIVGFENHSGRTFLGKGVDYLGLVGVGYGNNGKDHQEGARYRNVFGTYSHGPLLPKNPKFCDLLLKKALRQKYPAISLEEIDDKFETEAHNYMFNRMMREYSKKRG